MPLRLLFTSDVHGSEVVYRKFLNSARLFDASPLVLGGDITGKVMVPLCRGSDGSYSMDWAGDRRTLTEVQLPEWEKRIRDAGAYPLRAGPEELAAIDADEGLRERRFESLMVETVGRWVELARERLAPLGATLYLSPGNDDVAGVDTALDSDASGVVINPEGKLVELGGGWTMVTCGDANPTPWKSPREFPEEELEERLEALAALVPDPDRAIFNFHVPPYGTAIDQAPWLDSTLKPKVAAGAVQRTSVGSKAVRAVIERHQPALALHGHVHESAGSVRIGRTVCLNPGSEYSDGVLRAAVVLLGDKGLQDHRFVQG